MPKKKNFLGGMQNYNPNNGEYEPALKGPNGESPSGFKSFKKPKSEFDKAIDKKLGKKTEKPTELQKWHSSKEYVDKHNALAKKHNEGKITEEEMFEGIKKLDEEFENKGKSKEPFKLDKEKYPDVEETPYGFIYNVNGKSITDLAAQKKKMGYSLFTKDSGFSVAVGGDELYFKDFDSAYKYAKGEDKETKAKKPEGFDTDQEEFDYNYNAAKSLNNYEKAEKLKSLLIKNYGEESNAVKGVQKALDEMKESFDKGAKEKSLDDYTDELFKKTKLKTFTSKKYKNPQGEIIEIRRFGEGQDAIRYNETKKEVEQVWIGGERVK